MSFAWEEMQIMRRTIDKLSFIGIKFRLNPDSAPPQADPVGGRHYARLSASVIANTQRIRVHSI